MSGFKICTKCLVQKDLSNFDPRPNRPSKYDSHCKECKYKVKIQWEKDNKDHVSKRRTKLRKEKPNIYIAMDQRRHDKRRDFINKLKDVPCMDCNGRFLSFVMHFDHRDPKTKIESISRMHSCSLEMIKNEIAKCDIVCANCHAVRTYNQMQNGLLPKFKIRGAN